MKTGDWCLYEYKLAQVTVKDGAVREVRDGTFCTSGRDLSDQCRPLSLRNVSVSQLAEYWSDRLHKEGHAGLNHPDIHRHMVDLWCAACDAKEGAAQTDACEKIGKFAKAVLDATNNPGDVDGVPLIRRRYG